MYVAADVRTYTAGVKRTPALFPGKWLIAGYLLLLGVQIDDDRLRFAPSDVFLLAYVLLHWHRLRFPSAVWSMWHAGLVAMFVMATCVSVWSTGGITTYVLVNKDIGLLVLFVGYIVFTTVCSSWHILQDVLRLYVIGAVVQAALALAAWMAFQMTGMAVPWLNYGYVRVSGMLVDPNAFGGYVGTALVIHSCALFSGNPLIRGVRGLLSALVLTTALLLTLSRSAWIGSCLALLVTVLFRPRLLLAYAMTLCGTLLALLFAVRDSVFGIMTVADRDNTAQQRIDQVMAAIPMFSQAPLFGTGLAAFAEANGIIVHNTAVWIMTEFGLIGITIYLGFLIWFIARGIRAYKVAGPTHRGMVLGILAGHACMVGLSVGIEAFYQRHWWLLFAAIAAAHAITRCPEREATAHEQQTLSVFA